MTTEQTRLALGGTDAGSIAPSRRQGATDQWVYRGLYVYMDNGKVRAFRGFALTEERLIQRYLPFVVRAEVRVRG